MPAATAKTACPVDQDAALDAEIAAYRLLNQLRRAGFTFKAEGGDLLIAPPGQLDADQRQALKAAKPQILDLLRSEARPAPQPAPITWSALPPAPPPVVSNGFVGSQPRFHRTAATQDCAVGKRR